MLFAKLKDSKLRKNFLRLEYKIKTQKFVFINLLSALYRNSLKLQKSKISFLLSSLYQKSLKKYSCNSRKKILRRCLLNNRTKSVYRNFNLSRSILKNLMTFGLVPGYRKAVW